MKWLNMAVIAVQLLDGVTTLIQEAKEIAEQDGGLSAEQWAEIDARIASAQGRLASVMARKEAEARGGSSGE